MKAFLWLSCAITLTGCGLSDLSNAMNIPRQIPTTGSIYIPTSSCEVAVSFKDFEDMPIFIGDYTGTRPYEIIDSLKTSTTPEVLRESLSFSIKHAKINLAETVKDTYQRAKALGGHAIVQFKIESFRSSSNFRCTWDHIPSFHVSGRVIRFLDPPKKMRTP